MRNKIDRGERSLENEDKKQKQNKFMFLSTEEKMKGFEKATHCLHLGGVSQD